MANSVLIEKDGQTVRIERLPNSDEYEFIALGDHSAPLAVRLAVMQTRIHSGRASDSEVLNWADIENAMRGT